MPYEPIQQLDVENYGCIQKASFALSPLHAFIGPNDSGKSTTLRALRTVAQFATENFGPDPATPRPFDPLIQVRANATVLRIGYSDGISYGVGISGDTYRVHERVHAENAEGSAVRDFGRPGILKEPTLSGPIMDAVRALRSFITPATMVRFDPNALRRQARQLLAKEPIQFIDETGMGLASVYQAINSRDVDAFVAIRDKVKTLFPTVQNILVPSVEGSAVVLQARLADSTLVPAKALGEGLLYFLGYVALQYLAESKLFLVEEPENGLHPARIAEVMSILREISKTSQVIIATHSPLVVNELQGHEVSIVTRDPAKGTQVKLLKDVPGFEEASKVYQPGEFWVSYCDGNQEEPLITGKPRP